MSLKIFLVFLVISAALTVPAVYQVPNPVGHGTGAIHVSIVGMENIRLLNFSSLVVNTVRLGCGTYAVYTTNLTFTFSNAAVVPINASVIVYTSYEKTGVLLSQYPLTFEVPANSSNFIARAQMPAQVSIQNAPVLPTLAFSTALLQASNATLTYPVPKTIPLIRLITGGG
ncbi:MAG: hypothetical protein ABSG92_04770 [Conexivisphaerales archaeon]